MLVPGKPDESEMIKLVREGEMPEKGKKLPPEEIAMLEQWIAQGAKDRAARAGAGAEVFHHRGRARVLGLPADPHSAGSCRR